MDRRYALLAMALILLAGLPLLAGFVGPGWEASELAGLIATLLCVGLCGAPVRARDSTRPVLLSLRLHTILGWSAAVAVALHVGGLLLADRNVVEYLKPSLPIYMAAGVLAALLLLLLTASATLPLRRRLWRNHRAFQATHVIAGAALIALVAIHVIATARYTGHRASGGLLLGASIGALLMLLRPRRPDQVPGNEAGLRRRSVFGRHSMAVAGCLTTICCALAVSTVSTHTALREPITSRRTSLPLDFPHGKHLKVNCLVCHHNYADGTGFENCIMCHQSARADLKVGAQAQFHAFCFECHRHPAENFTAHGPVAGCAACHRTPDPSLQGVREVGQ